MSGKTNGDGRRETPAAAAPADPPMKKFYAAASIAPSTEGTCTVLLDGRPVRTPARKPLDAPEPVAAAIAAEWNAQETHIRPQTMPLTRLVNTAIDGVSAARRPVQDDIVAIAGNDLLAYRADAPEGLVARQCELWDPLVAQIERRFGVGLVVTSGVMPVAQDERFLQEVRSVLPQDPLPLAAMHQLTTLTGSALIAITVAEGVLAFEEGWVAAHVDEDWNIKLWGEDSEAAERRAVRRRDAEAAAFVLRETP